VKINYLNIREGEKRFRRVIWGQKLTLNHPSLVDEEEEIRVSADGSQKRGGREGERIHCCFFLNKWSSVHANALFIKFWTN